MFQRILIAAILLSAAQVRAESPMAFCNYGIVEVSGGGGGGSGYIDVSGVSSGDIDMNSHDIDAVGNFTVTGTSDLQGSVSDSTGNLTLADIVALSATTITSSGTADYGLAVTQTLNDATAAGGSDRYDGIKIDVTPTSVVGWNNVNLFALRYNAADKFKVDSSGNATIAGNIIAGSTGATLTVASGTDGQMCIKNASGSISRCLTAGSTALSSGSSLQVSGTVSAMSGSNPQAYLSFGGVSLGMVSTEAVGWGDSSTTTSGATFDLRLGRGGAYKLKLYGSSAQGVLLDFATADTLKIRNFADSGYAAVLADSLTITGDVIASGTGATVDVTTGTDGKLNICNAAKSSCGGITFSSSPNGFTFTNPLYSTDISAASGSNKQVSLTTSGFSGPEVEGISSMRLVWSSHATNIGSGSAALVVTKGSDDALQVSKAIRPAGDTFANLGAPSNGTVQYCSDCTKATPCAGSGNGALAVRLNGAWDCNP